MKRVIIIVGLLIMAVAVHLPAAEVPQAKELMVVGFGAMSEGDVGKARQDAIWSALRGAVRLSLSGVASSSVLEENAATLDLEIFSRVTEYVETFKILSETGRSDGHEVLLQARVDLRKLRDSLVAMGVLEVETAEEEVVRIRMVLVEVSRYPWYRELEDFLRQELEFIREIRLHCVMTGEFTLDVELVGNIQTLLDALTEKEFERFFLEITQDLEGQVLVRLRPRIFKEPPLSL
jgi:hypothetical protein